MANVLITTIGSPSYKRVYDMGRSEMQQSNEWTEDDERNYLESIHEWRVLHGYEEPDAEKLVLDI